LDPGAIPVHHAAVLVWLAQRDSATYREISDAFDLSNAAVSRTLNSLADVSPHRKYVLGLVEIYRDAREGRRYRARINKKGRGLALALEELMQTTTTTDQTDDHDHQGQSAPQRESRPERLGC
jgi:DNA-binding MarR family transcriptional regulator